MKLTFQLDYYTRYGELLQVQYTDYAGAEQHFLLHTEDGHTWYGTLTLPERHTPFTLIYAYRVVDDYGRVLRAEPEPARRILLQPDAQILLQDAWLDEPLPCALSAYAIHKAVRREASSMHFGGTWRAAGVVMPVFSLRSEGSWGIGDFADLQRLVQWAAEVGMQCVQILPINDTTTDASWGDSYPYNAISVFALHPLYLDPREFSHTAAFSAFQQAGEALNAAPQVEYEQVAAVKYAFLAALCAELQADIIRTNEYRQFLRENATWLDAYSTLFDRRLESILRAQGAAPKKSPQRIGKLAQYFLHRQMQRVHAKARSLGVMLKGDIPIGVNPHGVDAEQSPRLFRFEATAGAPPDAFAADGQNWGFPTYNWEAMAKDDYAWWRARFQHMERYFDAYRIDHVLGFFRIWEIPTRYSSGKMGHFRPALPYKDYEIAHFPRGLFLEEGGMYHPRIDAHALLEYQGLSAEGRELFNALYEDFFYHRHEAFWAEEGRRKLRAITSAAHLLPCAEDLGMVPACVPPTLRQLGILSLEIRRMPKAPGVRFADLMQNPYLSVATIATHDMAPLRLWWKQLDAETRAAYWHEVLHRTPDVPVPTELSADACREVVVQHLQCPSMLCLLALQDWLALSPELRSEHPETEQINVPADPKHHWAYRMHLTLEQLQAHRDFTHTLHALIEAAGR